MSKLSVLFIVQLIVAASIAARIVKEFECTDKLRLIGLNKICDTVFDCNDRSDEDLDMCKYRSCPRANFKCNSGQCIPEDLVCNGVNDCIDSSDETAGACAKHECLSHLSRCYSGHCMKFKPKALCNGNMECKDGSDENAEMCQVRLVCGAQTEAARTVEEEKHRDV